jgi:hypothetical protein
MICHLPCHRRFRSAIVAATLFARWLGFSGLGSPSNASATVAKRRRPSSGRVPGRKCLPRGKWNVPGACQPTMSARSRICGTPNAAAFSRPRLMSYASQRPSGESCSWCSSFSLRRAGGDGQNVDAHGGLKTGCGGLRGVRRGATGCGGCGSVMSAVRHLQYPEAADS